MKQFSDSLKLRRSCLEYQKLSNDSKTEASSEASLDTEEFESAIEYFKDLKSHPKFYYLPIRTKVAYEFLDFDFRLSFIQKELLREYWWRVKSGRKLISPSSTTVRNMPENRKFFISILTANEKIIEYLNSYIGLNKPRDWMQPYSCPWEWK